MPDSRRISAPRGRAVAITVDGRHLNAFEGDTVSTALLVEGVTSFHRAVDQSRRMPFCNMGTCFECTVTIDGMRLQRACLTPVRPDMIVVTGEES